VGSVAPVRISTVGSPVEGRVVDFLAREGDFVRGRTDSSAPAGQASQPPQDGAKPEAKQPVPLARLRTRSLELEIAAAEAELRVRQAELEQLTLSEPLEIEQARAREEAAQSLMRFTDSRLKRTRELHARGAASDDELEERESAALTAAEVYRERKAALELAESGYWREKVNQADARVRVQQETISQLKDDLAQHEIYAPFDGYVTQEHTEVGQWIGKGDPVAEVVELDYVYVEVPVLESHVSRLEPPVLVCRLEGDLDDALEQGVVSAGLRQALEAEGIRLAANATLVAELEGRRWRIAENDPSYTLTRRGARDVYEVHRPGTSVQVEIGALPGQTFSGEVAAIVPQADARSRSFPVKVRVKNPPSPSAPDDVLLKPGMFARVTWEENKTMLLLPKDAVVPERTSPVVWAVAPGAEPDASGSVTVVKVPVDVDLQKSQGEWIEVLGPVDQDGNLPLTDGQLVIVEGNERIAGKPDPDTGAWQATVNVDSIVSPEGDP
jgi:multidrug efflux pump subunit AcrA (membrane-fusion protein)